MSSERDATQGSPKDPIESATKGVTRAVLDFSAEKIDQWVTKFKNKQLAFIEDVETINIAKEQRTTSEWNLFKQHITNNEIRILFQMGLTLRRLEELEKPTEYLRRKILNKYDVRGLHIAQVVQSGIFSKYIGNVLERANTQQKLTFEIKYLFEMNIPPVY